MSDFSELDSFVLTFPKGDPGPQGPRGPRGFRGATGIQGVTGATGAQGVQGEVGETGEVGPQGPTGPQGIQGTPGNDGAPGIQGPPGTPGIGEVGPTGPTGIPGPTGAVGPPGAPGPTGSIGPIGPIGWSAYDHAVDGGFIGDVTAWLGSLVGAAGATGADGAAGAPGLDGITWHSGAGAPSNAVGNDGDYNLRTDTGDIQLKVAGAWAASIINIMGPMGATGPSGADGIDGVDGLNGTNGTNGTNGVDGTDGADGDLFSPPNGNFEVAESSAKPRFWTGDSELIKAAGLTGGLTYEDSTGDVAASGSRFIRMNSPLHSGGAGTVGFISDVFAFRDLPSETPPTLKVVFRARKDNGFNGTISVKLYFYDGAMGSGTAETVSIAVTSSLWTTYELDFANPAAGTAFVKMLVEQTVATSVIDIDLISLQREINADSVAWSAITSKPTTLAGYAITDAIADTGAAGVYGDGSDGDVTISADSTIAREMFYNNLTIDAGVSLNSSGYRVNVKNTLTIGAAGAIHRDGKDAVGRTAGAANSTAQLGPSGAGGIGSAGSSSGTSSSAQSNSGGGAGGAGGASGAGQSGGTAGAANGPAANQGGYRSLPVAATGSLPSATLAGGPGGGGGGAGATSTGGGGGGGAAVVIVCAKNIVNAGRISANGGAGGDATGSNAGGGGGGGGGVVSVIYRTRSGVGTYTASGGAGGAKTGTGTAGATGTAGSVIELVN